MDKITQEQYNAADTLLELEHVSTNLDEISGYLSLPCFNNLFYTEVLKLREVKGIVNEKINKKYNDLVEE